MRGRFTGDGSPYRFAFSNSLAGLRWVEGADGNRMACGQDGHAP